MGAPRAVRIPRAGARGAASESAGIGPRPVPSSIPADKLRNRAGTQRVVRLTAIYLIALAALYLGFALYARTAPGGSGPAGRIELLEFSLVAAAIGVAGAVLTLSPAPRAIVPRADGFVVVGRWGRSVEWAPLRDVTVRRVRRYPVGLLSEGPVESLEVSGVGHRARTYLLEAGLVPETPTERRAE